MLCKLQSNIFPLLNAYAVRKYNSTLKGFTVLLTPSSLCSSFGLPSCCSCQIEKPLYWTPSFPNSLMCTTAQNKHSGDYQASFPVVVILCLLTFSWMPSRCYGPVRMLTQVRPNIVCQGINTYSRFYTLFYLDCHSQRDLNFICRMFGICVWINI